MDDAEPVSAVFLHKLNIFMCERHLCNDYVASFSPIYDISRPVESFSFLNIISEIIGCIKMPSKKAGILSHLVSSIGVGRRDV